MPSPQHEAIVHYLMNAQAPADPTLAELREGYDQNLLAFTPVEGTTVSTESADGIRVDLVTAPGADPERHVLFVHGGGFVLGSAEAYREFASRISAATKARVAVVDYRRAPEATAPAALDDCLAAYRWLLARGADAARTALAGDSGGGGLALLLAARIAAAGLPVPAAVVAFSPWIDISFRPDMPDERESDDPMLTVAYLRWLAASYLAGAAADDPANNALFADLAGLPPVLLQTGTRDLTHQDSVVFAKRAEEAGVEVVLDVYPELIHDWPAFGPDLPEGQEALARVGDFLGKRLAGS
ncbi:alpha/beta hydrolase [Acrocarpospora sp. B8E8]|uniref:alpha/beta hydrolase n=1 Tax=Acrocarpospora sp. B8E8 TaxID=3153572 RepID=UPI00325EFC5B